MKTSDSALRALLHGSTSAAFCNLITLVTKAGTTVRWATDSYDIAYGGNTFTAGGTGTAPGLKVGRIREAVGLEVSTLELTLDCGTTAQIGGVALQLAALNGVLDDARVTVQRAYQATPGGAVVGNAISRFAGVVSDCEVDSFTVRLRVQSDLYKLDEVLPRHLIREKCSWALGDAGCGVNLASFSSNETADAASGVTNVQFHRGTQLTLPITGGTILFTSGALSGVARTILGTSFYFSAPFYYHFVWFPNALPSAPAGGESITLTAGCDKTIATCSGTFSNLTRRRGFDFVPPPDSVTR